VNSESDETSANPSSVGCRVQGAGCRVKGVECRVEGVGCRVWGAGCGVQGVGCSHTCAKEVKSESEDTSANPSSVGFSCSASIACKVKPLSVYSTLVHLFVILVHLFVIRLFVIQHRRRC